MKYVSRGYDQCADLEVISRLTVGEDGVVITHVTLILIVDTRFNLLIYFLANLHAYVLKNNKTILINIHVLTDLH